MYVLMIFNHGVVVWVKYHKMYIYDIYMKRRVGSWKYMSFHRKTCWFTKRHYGSWKYIMVRGKTHCLMSSHLFHVGTCCFMSMDMMFRDKSCCFMKSYIDSQRVMLFHVKMCYFVRRHIASWRDLSFHEIVSHIYK